MRCAGRSFALALLLYLLCGGALFAQTRTLSSGDVTLEFWPQQERLAQSLLPGADYPSFPGIAADILRRGEPVRVVLAPDEARFRELTGGRVPDWGAGVAMPQAGLVVLPAYASDRTSGPELPSILRHELAHIALQRHLGKALVPRWFTEGYATWSSGQFDPSAGWQLRLALLTERAPTLDSLTLHWPLLEVDARLAYLLSASAVTYLYSLGTPESFDRFLANWAAGGDLERALRTVYVVSSPQLERLWRAHVKRSYGWVQVLAQSLFLWSIAALIILVLFIVRRRRNRGRLERLREDELPDEPAFWTEADPLIGDDAASETPPPPDERGRGHDPTA